MSPNAYEIHLIDARPRTFTAQMMLEAEAYLHGCSCLRRSKNRLTLTTPNGKNISFTFSRLSRTPRTAIGTAMDKAESRRLLLQAGLPVPRGKAFGSSDHDKALGYAKELGFPVVVKPASGRQGLGVTANIRDETACLLALNAAVNAGFKDGRVLVEEHIEGLDLRVFATRDRAISVIERQPAHVVGDGVRSIEELVSAKNRQRRLNPYLRSKPIELDKEPSVLETLGLRPDSVPAVGQKVVLSSVANLSRGGDSVDLTQVTHPSILKIAQQAVQAIPGLPYGGVDILLQDPRRAFGEQKAGIIEINGTPDIMMHPFPVHGDPINVPSELVRDSLHRTGCRPRRSTRSDIRVQMKVFGRVTNVGYRRWFSREAERYGLKALVENVGTTVEAQVEGPANRITMLVRASLAGPRKASVYEIRVNPLDQPSETANLPPRSASTEDTPAREITSIEPVSATRRQSNAGHDDREIVQHIHSLSYEDLPPEVIDRAKLLLLDAAGVIILGAHDPLAERIISTTGISSRFGDAGIFTTGIRAPTAIAAFANGCFAQVHDFNDGHRTSSYYGGSRHPGRVVIPTALAEAEALGASGKELIAAVVTGYDVAAKIRSGPGTVTKSDYYASSAVAAKLRRYSPQQISTTLGIAGYLAPAQQGAMIPRFISRTILNGLRSRVGIEAASMAKGLTKGPKLRDHPEYTKRFINSGLGSEFEVMNTYLKPYPICRMAHAAIDAVSKMKREHNFDANKITRILIEQLPQGMYVAKSKRLPKTNYKLAQFNLFYGVARAALDGTLTYHHFDQPSIGDPRVRALIDRTEVRARKDLGLNYPNQARPAIATIELENGERISQRVDRPIGDPHNPLDQQQVIQKFSKNAEVCHEQRTIDRIIDLILNIEEQSNLSNLVKHLA